MTPVFPTLMSDEKTKRLQALDMAAQDQLRQLLKLLTEILSEARQQQEDLLSLAIALPMGTIDKIKLIRTHLDTLSRRVGQQFMELRQQRALLDTAGYINSSRETKEVLNMVMDRVIQITGAERGYIMLKNRQTGELDFRAARGLDREQLSKEDFIVSTSIVDEVAAAGVPLLTENASRDQRFSQNESVVGFQLRSILAAPLIVRDEIIGVIYCDNRILTGQFKEHELQLLIAFANQAAVAIENARLFESSQAQLAELTAARELLSNVFASIGNAVLTINPTGEISDCNAAAEGVLNRSRADLVGHPMTETFTLAWFGEAWGRAQAGGREQLAIEPVINGQKRYWQVNLSPLRDQAGLALVIDDRTHAREREEKLGIASGYLKFNAALIGQAGEIEAEEREISVLFCDVRGFTTFSEKLEPDKLMTVINRYLSLSSDAIDFYDGLVDKYMGDAVTGLFNTTFNAQSNHAERAVRAAMNMLLDLEGLYEVLPEDQRLQYGIGIHTGIAVLGNVGGAERREFTAMGDAMDLAKLLQENALGGEVLISAGTYAQVKDLYECEEIPPRKSKDYPNFDRMYRIVRAIRKTN